MDGPEAATQLYGTREFGQLLPTLLELPNAEMQQAKTEESGFTLPRCEHCLRSICDSQMGCFLACIRENRVPIPGELEGIVDMTVVEAACELSKTGKVVNTAQ